MAWTTPTNFTASSTLTSSKLNTEVIANLLHLYDLLTDPPRCTLRRAANYSLTAADEIEWDTEDVDTDTMWASSPNPDRITPQTAGRYLITGYLSFADKTDSTNRTCEVRVNNVAVVPSVIRTAISGAATVMPFALSHVFNGSTDYITLVGAEGASGSVNVTAQIDVQWVAPT